MCGTSAGVICSVPVGDREGCTWRKELYRGSAFIHACVDSSQYPAVGCIVLQRDDTASLDQTTLAGKCEPRAIGELIVARG